MTVNYFINLATSAGISVLLTLQEQKFGGKRWRPVSAADRGFVLRTMTKMPLIVAWRSDQIVSHMVTKTLATKAHVEAVQSMLRSYPAPPIAIFYGPVCMAESERRRGLADAMFVRLRSELPNQPP